MSGNKQSVNALSLALTYAGCFFGAGFVSGQELWQFFGAFGFLGYCGIALSMVLFFVFGAILLRTVQISGEFELDTAIIPGKNKIIRSLFADITLFFMFGIFVIMSAGVGALINQVFDIPHYVGCVLFCIIISIVALSGISGAVKFFSLFVPILVVSTLVICVIALSKFGFSPVQNVSSPNSLLGTWWFSAINYVSYNMIASVGTIIPIGQYLNKSRTIFCGILFGCIIMLSVACGILTTITTMNSSVQTQLPMLDVAFRLNNACGYIYAILLFIGMFGTSLASVVSIIVYLNQKKNLSRKSNLITIILIGIAGLICSLSGFQNLVGTVYPVFGYIGFAVLICIIYNYFLLLKSNK